MNDPSILRDYAEKRDFIRMQVNARIELSVLATGEIMDATCVDLSGMGMRLKLKQPLSIDTEVQTSLPSNSAELPTFKTAAQVVRCDPSDNGYLVGLEIVKIEQ